MRRGLKMLGPRTPKIRAMARHRGGNFLRARESLQTYPDVDAFA